MPGGQTLIAEHDEKRTVLTARFVPSGRVHGVYRLPVANGAWVRREPREYIAGLQRGVDAGDVLGCPILGSKPKSMRLEEITARLGL